MDKFINEKINYITRILVENYGPEKIYLFGSYAYGTPTKDSDIDILVIKESSTPRPVRHSEAGKYFYRIGVPLDMLVFTPDEVEVEKKRSHSFIHDVLRKGKVLYERNA